MKIIIIDDDAIVRESLKNILQSKGIEVLALGSSGREAIELYAKYRPDILLMDIRMDDLNGLEATSAILKRDVDAKILLITTFQDDEYISKAIELGCCGYILKQNIAGILPALNAVANNQLVYDSKIVNKLSPSKSHHLPNFLSEREKDILLLVADGLNNKEISERLFLSEGTVRNYISALLEKLNLRDRTQLAIFYYRGLP